ncbi:GumC family protein [Anatilimnocola floriformis]|uniref:GumC family protein n=1 Tax=Anatilimnocola floriformis TaxID=2948575 RepID=UPI0020C57454|nr:Wzz/FepE/Etk N-terminal domain-containing protein [Anatilimnocola floriformis]
MENLYQPEINVKQALDAAWRHKGKALLAFLVVCALTAVYLSTAKRVYESEAKVYVRVGRESVALDPTATTGAVVTLQDTREADVNSIEQLLLSRETAEQVVDQLGVDTIFGKKPSTSSAWSPKTLIKDTLQKLEPYNLNPLQVFDVRDKAITLLKKNLRVTAVRKTSYVTVSYSCEDPATARDVVDALIAQVQAEHLRINRTKGSHEFFEKKELQLRTDLEKLEGELKDYKNKTGFAELDTQRKQLLERIATTQKELHSAQSDLSAARAEIKAREEELAQIPELVTAQETTGFPQSTEGAMRTKLYDLEVLEQGLAAVQTDDSPQLKSVREQIKQARGILGQEKTAPQTMKALNKVRQESELALSTRQAALAALEARELTLEKQLTTARSELKAINQSEIEIAQLQRSISLASHNHGKYAEYLEQARIDDELHTAKVSSLNLAQKPSYSITPISPKPIPTLGIGFVLACCSAAGIVFLAERGRLSRATNVPVAAPVRSEVTLRTESPARPEAPLVDELALSRRNEAIPSLPR